jgi:hypothetical protein
VPLVLTVKLTISMDSPAFKLVGRRNDRFHRTTIRGSTFPRLFLA